MNQWSLNGQKSLLFYRTKAGHPCWLIKPWRRRWRVMKKPSSLIRRLVNCDEYGRIIVSCWQKWERRLEIFRLNPAKHTDVSLRPLWMARGYTATGDKKSIKLIGNLQFEEMFRKIRRIITDALGQNSINLTVKPSLAAGSWFFQHRAHGVPQRNTHRC